MILSDNETKVDLLNNEAIAKTIEKPEHPVTVGVHGDWGAGKSSVLEMIEVALNADDRLLCLKFNGWRFQGFEDAKITLIEGIVTGLIEKWKAPLAVFNTALGLARTGTSNPWGSDPAWSWRLARTFGSSGGRGGRVGRDFAT